MITTDELRKRFLDFFKSKNHKIVPSDSLAPKNDPSVLFTSAGMNQFKEQFLGKVTDFRRAASSQKCLRTGDLEKVGHTPSHHTFFEMLGNFSFGDYFKKDAITWAWEFLTKDLKITAEKLWVSVYEEDNESYNIWLNEIKVPANKIYKFGQKENFWPSNAINDGPNGPCGPCSEIFFDWGKDTGCGKSDCSPACDCGRFVEIWNLVFTQFNRKEGGKLDPLPNKNIDTGMGLERIVSCLQGVKTNFEIDIFKPIIDEIRQILEIKPFQFSEKLNCIADHIRAVVFAIGDGVLPSNEGRGYVVRKLIRRASWFAQESGFKKPFLYKLVSRICNLMKEPYPELAKRRDNISDIVLSEEEKFINNINEGSDLLKETIAELKSKNINRISGQIIFKLYDTYGFPLELTEIFAKDNNLELDLAGFNQEMEKQKKMARAGSNISGDIFSKDIIDLLPTQFLGYETTRKEVQIIQIVKSKQSADKIKEGDEAWIILDKTPFYGESGGQVGDTGKIYSSDKKSLAEVVDTKQIDGSIAHIVKVKKGGFKIQDKVLAEVNSERRQAIRRSHTATHLLQSSLRKVLGEHVQQSGSLVEPDYFRFDFTHFKDLKDDELARIEDLINEKIRANDKLSVEVMEKDKALKSGAIALFGEKYGESVRVVSIADYSREFCGGTHLDYTGDVAMMLIDNEGSVGSGLRRIQAFTGKLAYEKLKNSSKILKDLSVMLKAKIEDIPSQVESLLEKNKKLEKEVMSLTEENISLQIADIINSSKKTVEDYSYIICQFKNLDSDILRKASDLLISKLTKKSVIFLASDNGLFICRVSKDLKDKTSASGILGKILESFGGSGGGRPDFAQGGLKDKSRLSQVMKKAEEIIKKELSQ
ncbi:MAG: alanine--tRNA ligase [Candidatus Omnitrophica bacterium]|nr:alanine--tRNA ligase [Candidatus Omnitrophota bacterium]MDD5352600.1 alanine--tRNA ligase [Candidatus Omnitrophota bacterium]MDD5550198.1 alanine--tRNA ligase [Candidatus Omnitrophota bacterium]